MKKVSKLQFVKEWVKDLRSGRYKQTTGALYRKTEKGPRYCCLGVACRTAVRLGMKDNLHEFWKEDSEDGVKSFQKWFGNPNPSVQCRGEFTAEYVTTLAELNDTEKLNFKEIADVIEENFIKRKKK